MQRSKSVIKPQKRARAGASSFLAALLLLTTTPGLSQAPTPQGPAGSEAGTTRVADEEVIVRGMRLSDIEFDLRRYVLEFVEEAASQSRGRGFARWDRRFCVGVVNLEAGPAQYIVDRVSALSREVGLEPGEPGCNPDSIIIFSTDAGQTASLMVENEPRVFRPVGGHAGTELGLGALDDFIATERAVRWWHVSLPVSARTRTAAIRTEKTPCFGTGPPKCYPYVTVNGPSHLHSGIIDEMQYVIIIVDAAKLMGISWAQLADYLGMLSLAQINPEADPQSFDSILNLFSNPVASSGLTDWDLNYLQALYAFDQERITRMQTNQIVSRIVKQEQSASE